MLDGLCGWRDKDGFFAGDIQACLTLSSWFMHRQGGRGYWLMQTVNRVVLLILSWLPCSRNGRIASRL